MDAREVALLVLNTCERQGGWSDGALKKQLQSTQLDNRDAALATQLCFGVVQNRMLLDFYLARFSNIPLRRMESKVVQALRLGLYQMLFLTRVPQSAAVNRSVELTRSYCKNPRAPGMVNGILRALQRSLDDLPTIPKTDPAEYLGTLYSHPKWLVEAFLSRLGSEETARLLAANNTQPPITAFPNTLRATTQALRETLAEQGVEAQAHPWLEDCLILRHTGSVEGLSAFQEGLFYIQDPASHLAVLAAGPCPGMRLLDVCAAPGGKTFASGMEMEGKGEIVACDLHPHKKNLLQKGAQRLGLECVQAVTADGRVRVPEWEDSFDCVVVDVPCSGLGVIRKKPDIRYKDPNALENLPEVQRAILENAAGYVKPGGVLLYSTCTLLPRENEENVAWFLERNSSFSLQPFSLPGEVGGGNEGMVTLWPHIHDTDGFFICRLRRNE